MRILVRYTIPKYTESGIVGIDLPEFDTMTAKRIQAAIQEGICDQYNNVSTCDVKIDDITYLGARQVAAAPIPAPVQSPLNISKNCMVCGKNHGASGLPCPTMTPMAKLL
ncbi:hypothetical protein D3C73_982440 [compost metagenome]